MGHGRALSYSEVSSTEEADLVKDVLNDAHSMELFSGSLPGASAEEVEAAVRAWAHGYLQRQSAAVAQGRQPRELGRAVTAEASSVRPRKSDAPR